jgi:hypothetical protein
MGTENHESDFSDKGPMNQVPLDAMPVVCFVVANSSSRHACSLFYENCLEAEPFVRQLSTSIMDCRSAEIGDQD